MKKAYNTPTLATSGSITDETLGGDNPGAEINALKPVGGGSVGFYL